MLARQIPPREAHPIPCGETSHEPTLGKPALPLVAQGERQGALLPGRHRIALAQSARFNESDIAEHGSSAMDLR